MKQAMVILMLLAMLMLPGCGDLRFTFNPQDLYALPTLPAKYTELNLLINNILGDGAEYAAPSAGTNTQPVQLVDLDGDGREDAVAFFRNSSQEKPLKIYIFTATDDAYLQTDLIEGSGTGIYSIAYQDMDNDGHMEIQVSWKTTDLQVLEIYSQNETGAELLVRSSYVKYTTMDLNQDLMQELVVIRADEQGESLADYYVWQEDGTLTLRSSARISVTMAELSQQGQVYQGTLQNGEPALFVTGVTDAAHITTDILAVSNGELKNIVLSEITGISPLITSYAALYPSDITGDGVTEVPCPQLLALSDDETPSCQWVDWYAYDKQGSGTMVCRTYHNTEDKWYFYLPEEWLDRVWMTRTTTQDEATVNFYLLDDHGQRGELFFRITAIGGSSREYRASKGERFILSRQSEVVYTAELLEANHTWRYGLTADQVRESFRMISAQWIAD